MKDVADECITAKSIFEWLWEIFYEAETSTRHYIVLADNQKLPLMKIIRDVDTYYTKFVFIFLQ